MYFVHELVSGTWKKVLSQQGHFELNFNQLLRLGHQEKERGNQSFILIDADLLRFDTKIKTN